MARNDPFQRMVDKVVEMRRAATEELVTGHWDGEAEARALCGKIEFCRELLDAMRTIAGPGTDFGEEDLLK